MLVNSMANCLPIVQGSRGSLLAVPLDTPLFKSLAFIPPTPSALKPTHSRMLQCTINRSAKACMAVRRIVHPTYTYTCQIPLYIELLWIPRPNAPIFTSIDPIGNCHFSFLFPSHESYTLVICLFAM